MIFHDILLQETRIKSKESLQNDDKEGSSALYVKNGNGISGTPVQSSPNPA